MSTLTHVAERFFEHGVLISLIKPFGGAPIIFCFLLISQQYTHECVPSQGKHHPVNVFEVSPAGSVSDQEAVSTAAAAIGFGTGPLSRVPSEDQLQGGEGGATHDAVDVAPTQGVPLTVMPSQLKPIIGRQVCTTAWQADSPLWCILEAP